ncbi:restriction endonuclease subunit S [Collinsella tanakaei]|uniref:restriction endonuclease subunit S n=1 Tax=Collinsella tanakaei TaxID=626935 RepID=UPI0022E8389B|nr:restriction endonuclease subunit S [Collinsella tanakaei]
MAAKPRFDGEWVRLGELTSCISKKNKDGRCATVCSVTNSQGFVLSTEFFTKEVFSKELRTYKLVERNQLAYNPSRINVGSIALQDIADEVVVSPLYIVFAVDTSRIDSSYLLRYLKSRPGLKQVEFNSIGTVRNNLKYDGLCQIPVPLPSLEVQRSRVRSLIALETEIKEGEETLSKLDVLVKSRFAEMFGDFKTNPYSWDVYSFNQFASIDTHMTKDYASFADAPHVGIDSIESCTGELIGYRTVREDNVRSGKYVFGPDHIIYSKIRPALNKVALPDFEGVCSADAYPILPNKRLCNRVFLAYVMRSDYFLEYILPLSGRAQMPKVNKKALMGFSMPLPPLTLQQEFADFAAEVDKSRFIVQQQIEKLQMLYDSLAQEYFS